MKRDVRLQKPYSSHPGDKHLTVVLARTGGHHPWVTWVHNSQDGGYFWGHYFETLKDANEDFRKRGRE